MGTPYESTSETSNFARLSRLVVDVCSDVLRAVLEKQVPFRMFSYVISNQRSVLEKCLNRKQKSLLFPKCKSFSGSYDWMDISLLYVLLRNVGNIKPHKKGWGNEPDAADRSLSANIERIHRAKNDSYSHLLAASINDFAFKTIWNELSTAIDEIEKLMFPGVSKYKEATDKLLIQTLDAELEATYIKQLQDLYDEDRDLKEEIKKMRAEQREIGLKVDTIQNCVRALETKLSIEANHNRETTLAMINRHRDNKTYLFTRSARGGIDLLKSNGIVIYTGETGTGKLTCALETMKQVVDDDKSCIALTIDDVTKWDTYVSADVNAVVYLKDVIGKERTNQNLVEEADIFWEKIYACIQKGKVKVVMSLRCDIMKKNMSKLTKHLLFSSEHVIDLSSGELKLNKKEKTDMLNSYFEHYHISVEKRSYISFVYMYSGPFYAFKTAKKTGNVKLGADEFDSIIDSDPPLGYPYTCFHFCKDRKHTKFGLFYFQLPPESLVEIINQLMMSKNHDDQVQYCILAYMFLKGGKIDLDEADENLMNQVNEFVHLKPKFDIQDIKLVYLDHVYITRESQRVFLIKHKTILRAVGLSLGSIDKKRLLELCDIDFVCHFFRPESHQLSEWDPEVTLTIDRNSLIHKFLSYLQEGGNPFPVGLHVTMGDEKFVAEFINVAGENDRFTKTITESCEKENSLFVAACYRGYISLMDALYTKKYIQDYKFMSKGLDYATGYFHPKCKDVVLWFRGYCSEFEKNGYDLSWCYNDFSWF